MARSTRTFRQVRVEAGCWKSGTPRSAIDVLAFPCYCRATQREREKERERRRKKIRGKRVDERRKEDENDPRPSRENASHRDELGA